MCFSIISQRKLLLNVMRQTLHDFVNVLTTCVRIFKKSHVCKCDNQVQIFISGQRQGKCAQLQVANLNDLW